LTERNPNLAKKPQPNSYLNDENRGEPTPPVPLFSHPSIRTSSSSLLLHLPDKRVIKPTKVTPLPSYSSFHKNNVLGTNALESNETLKKFTMGSMTERVMVHSKLLFFFLSINYILFHIYIYIYICVCVCMHVYVYVICIYVCVRIARLLSPTVILSKWCSAGSFLFLFRLHTHIVRRP
jgi:hypothetical protein